MAQFVVLVVGFYAVLWPSEQVDYWLAYLMPAVALFALYTGYGYAKVFLKR